MWQHTRESACYGIVIALQHAYRSSIMIGARETPVRSCVPEFGRRGFGSAALKVMQAGDSVDVPLVRQRIM